MLKNRDALWIVARDVHFPLLSHRSGRPTRVWAAVLWWQRETTAMSPQSSRLSTTFISVALTAACCASPSAAAVIAYDVGTNYTARQPYLNLNGGFGFGSWTLSSGLGTNEVSKTGLGYFNQTATSANTYVITRSINVPLAVGDTLSLNLFGSNAKKTGSGVSLLLYAGGAQAASLSYFINDVTWRWNDGSGAVSTGVNYVKDAIVTLTFTRTSSPAGYEFSLAQPGQTTYNKTGTITGGSASSAINQLWFSSTSGAATTTTLAYNTLQVQSVPEPSAIAMLATAAVGGLGLVHLRQRRRYLRAAACPAPLPLAA